MSELHKKYVDMLEAYAINTPLRLAHFMAQLEHESDLKPISENLNYSAEGLLKTFPKYFKTATAAKLYARKPDAIANVVYAGRMGNTNKGDGWRYRGRGFIQITGRSNYQLLAKSTGLDCVKNPDLLLQEREAMLSACWFWTANNLNAVCDKDDIIGLTRKINGGLNGLDHRKKLLAKWKKLLG